MRGLQKPLDEDALLSAARHHDLIVTMEENVISGGMGEQVMRFRSTISLRVLAIAIPDEYVEHGNGDSAQGSRNRCGDDHGAHHRGI